MEFIIAQAPLDYTIFIGFKLMPFSCLGVDFLNDMHWL